MNEDPEVAHSLADFNVTKSVGNNSSAAILSRPEQHIRTTLPLPQRSRVDHLREVQIEKL